MNAYQTIVGVLFFLYSCSILSQTIQGTVKNAEGVKIPGVTFLLSAKSNTSAIVEFFIANDQGVFSYKLKKEYQGSLYITSSILGYEQQTDSIITPTKGKVYNFDFILPKATTELEEVVLIKERDFKIKKDTVAFNAEAYKDGTEEKVEDLLKNIPGIDIESNGRIKYKGKAVAEVQLDGDDLFGSNYTIGTKNISVDIIDEIEAIENFSKNPLLKGIENSNNVAINLKLKKGKADYSGNGNVGLGYGDKVRYDLSSTILGVSKKVKSFGVFSFNNIGLNKSSFDYFSTTLTVEELLNRDLYGKRNITVNSFKPGIGDARIRLNNEWSGNYNLIHKISPKFKIRYNVFYVNDELASVNFFNNTFFTAQDNISFSDQVQTILKPEQGRADIKIDYKISARSLVEFETSVSKHRHLDRVNFQRNIEQPSISNLETEDFFLKNKLLVTQKLDDALVLQFSSLYSRNNLPQSFRVNGNFILNTDEDIEVNQTSEFRKEVFQNNISLLGKSGKIKYNFSLGTDFYDIPFKSTLINEEGAVVSGFQNSFDYKRKKYISSFSLNFTAKKWQIGSITSLNYIKQNLNNILDFSNQISTDQWYSKVLLNIKHSFNENSKITFRGGLDYTAPNENYLFSNNVVTSNRILTNNEVSLELSKKYNYRLNYRLDNLAKSIELKASLGYSKVDRPFLSAFRIDNNVTRQTYFQAPVINDNLFSEFSLSKYIRFLRTTVMHTSVYSLSNFNNVVNESEFRENTSTNYTGDFFFKTSFAFPVNFENNLSYSTAVFESSEGNTNTNNSIKNTFRVIYRPNKSWVFSAFNYYFIPNLDNKDNTISFLDFSVRFKSEKTKWLSGRFVGKNLFDTRFFEQINNSDFSTTIYQSNLIPRYFMLSLDLSF